jgi:hypothetical protein
LDIGFPIHGELKQTLQLSDNGIVKFETGTISPIPFADGISDQIVAAGPFWADIDLSYGDDYNDVYYHLYDESNAADIGMLMRIDNYVRANKAGQQDYSSKLSLVVTWYRVRPFSKTKEEAKNEEASFQMWITTDYKNTFAVFIYGDEEMRWSKIRVAKTAVPKSPTTTEIKSIVASNDLIAVDNDKGNTISQKPGEWIYQISDKAPEAALRFINWEKKQKEAGVSFKDVSQTCPCALFQIFMDARYYWKSSIDLGDKKKDAAYWNRFKPIYHKYAKLVQEMQQNGDTWKTTDNAKYVQKQAQLAQQTKLVKELIPEEFVCFIPFNPERIGTTDKAVAPRCCYDMDVNTYVNTISPGGDLPASHYSIFAFDSNSLGQSQLSSAAFFNDSSMFKDVCVANNLCDRYLSYRPVPDCQTYIKPAQGNAFGDPHIGTIDGYQYTFNGLGDYYLLKANTSSAAGIQSRTCVAYTTVPPSRATVFCAFAIYENGQPTIEIYKNTNSNTVTFKIDGTDFDVTKFVDAYSVTEQGRVVIEYEEVDNSTSKVKVVMPSALSMIATINERMLQPTIAAPDVMKGITRGLMGNNNGNADDELIAPDGTVLSRNSTEEQIYNSFGLKWTVPKSDVKFTSPFQPAPNYTPFFYTTKEELFNNNATLLAEALTVCGGEIPTCLYDFKVTADAAAAKSGVAAVEEFNAQEELLARVPPEIKGPKKIEVTFGKTHQFTINAVSNVSTQLIYDVSSNDSTVKMINATSGLFEITVSQLNTSVTVKVRDEKNNNAQLNVIVHMCGCKNNGTCNLNEINAASEYRNPLLEFHTCSCKMGWDGS